MNVGQGNHTKRCIRGFVLIYSLASLVLPFAPSLSQEKSTIKQIDLNSDLWTIRGSRGKVPTDLGLGNTFYVRSNLNSRATILLK